MSNLKKKIYFNHYTMSRSQPMGEGCGTYMKTDVHIAENLISFYDYN